MKSSAAEKLKKTVFCFSFTRFELGSKDLMGIRSSIQKWRITTSTSSRFLHWRTSPLRHTKLSAPSNSPSSSSLRPL